MQSYGQTRHVITDKEYTFNYDANTGNTLTITYETPEDEALSTLPPLGSVSGMMRGAILKKATVKPGEGGQASVRLEYGKPDEEEEEDDEGTGEGGGEEDDGEVVEQSLDGSVNDEPLLSHPKAQSGISDAHREYLKAVQDGTRVWELVNELEEDGAPKRDKDGQPVMKPLKQLLKGLSGNGQEVLKMLQQGIHSYRSPGATYREARLVRAKAVTLDGLGQIANPSGAPTPAGRNWLMVGKAFTKVTTGSKKRWRVETIYELSAPGGWNKQLYTP